MGVVKSSMAKDDPLNKDNIEIELKIPIDKPIDVNLKLLLNQSLTDVRKIYIKHLQNSKKVYIDRLEFCKISPFPGNTSQLIFEKFSVLLKSKKRLLNIYEFLAGLTLTSYSNYIKKLHCAIISNSVLYLLFDLDGSEDISVVEIIIIFSCCVRSYCRFINEPQPLQEDIAKFAKMVFLKSDVQTDNSLDLQELINWVENSHTAYSIFDKFEPKFKIHEDVSLFRHMMKFSQEDADEIFEQLDKAYREEDLLKIQEEIRSSKNKSVIKEKYKRFFSSDKIIK